MSMKFKVKKYKYEVYYRVFNRGISYRVIENGKCIGFINQDLNIFTKIKENERWDRKNSKPIHLSEEENEFFKLLGS